MADIKCDFEVAFFIFLLYGEKIRNGERILCQDFPCCRSLGTTQILTTNPNDNAKQADCVSPGWKVPRSLRWFGAGDQREVQINSLKARHHKAHQKLLL